MTTKVRKRIRRESVRKENVRAAVEQLTADLPEYAEPLFQRRADGGPRWKVVYGGRGGARSWTVARALLIIAAQAPTRILCTRELQTSIKDSVHQLLRDQIELMGLKGFTVLEREIRHTNGSLFLFEGLRHNVTKIKSLEGIDICWVEEAERITAYSWSVLSPTIRKKGSEIWVTFNPDQEDDATYQRLVVNPPPDALVLKVSWEDNPWFHETELVAEKDWAYKTDPDAADWVWGGNIRHISEAQILKGKWKVEEFTPFFGHENPEECESLKDDGICIHAWHGPYQGLDFGFASDPAAALRMWLHERTLYVEYEMFRIHLEIDDMAKAICDAIPGFEHYVTRADSSRPDSISYLRRHGLPRIIGAKKGAGSVEDGVAHLRSYESIVIHPRCKHFKQEAKLYSYKVDEKSGDVLPIIVDKHNHLMDGARYGLEPMIKPQRKVGVLFANPAARNRIASTNGVHTDHPHTRLIGINTRTR